MTELYSIWKISTVISFFITATLNQFANEAQHSAFLKIKINLEELYDV